jgi:hypothetical protein
MGCVMRWIRGADSAGARDDGRARWLGAGTDRRTTIAALNQRAGMQTESTIAHDTSVVSAVWGRITNLVVDRGDDTSSPSVSSTRTSPRKSTG